MALDAKELIRERLNFVELVSQYVALKPAGSQRLKGLCPFHSEKTPSFHVLPEKGLYHCFGCSTGGDVFDFVMRIENISFLEALRLLAARTGVELPDAPPQSKGKLHLFDVLEVAATFFQRTFLSPAGEAARQYLLGRQLTQEAWDTFQLGYAPDSWDALIQYANSQGVTPKDLSEAGLTIERERGGFYDRFRHRVMFPIQDSLGRVVGFGGRVLNQDDTPKYLNSPETALFEKKRILYGLHQARKAIKDTHQVILVEGYTDVIALHLAGIDNALAVMSAALTPEHTDQLARLGVERLELCFDGDEAGQRAILAGLDASVRSRFLVRAIRLPPNEDPLDTVQRLGGEGFRALIDAGLSEIDYRLERILVRHQVHTPGVTGSQGPTDAGGRRVPEGESRDALTPEGRRQVILEVAPAIQWRDALDPVAAELKRRLVDKLGITHQELDSFLRSGASRQAARTVVPAVQAKGLARAAHSRERQLLQLVMQDPSLIAKVRGELTFTDPLVQEAFEVADRGIEAVLERFRGRPEAREILADLLTETSLFTATSAENLQEVLEQCLYLLQRERLLEKIKGLRTQLGQTQGPARMDLMYQISELGRQLDQLKRQEWATKFY